MCVWGGGTPTKRQPHITLDPASPTTSHRPLSRAFLPTRLHCSPLPTVTLSRTGTRAAPEHHGLFWGVEGADLLGERRLFSQEKESARPRLAGGFLPPGEHSPCVAELKWGGRDASEGHNQGRFIQRCSSTPCPPASATCLLGSPSRSGAGLHGAEQLQDPGPTCLEAQRPRLP